MFTTANPSNGSLPPEHMAWVVFAHGTVFYSTPGDGLPVDATFDMLAKEACSALTQLGRAQAGTESADFNPHRLEDWFPDEPVWWVAFSHDSIGTLVTMHAQPLAVGLSGRARRDLDVAEQSIVCIRSFDGTSRRSD
jgi:hypothetical protein